MSFHYLPPHLFRFRPAFAKKWSLVFKILNQKNKKCEQERCGGLKQTNQKVRFLSWLLLALFLLQPFFALAIVYQPGETLNPACAPTDASCGVAAPLTASSTSSFSLGGTAPTGTLLYVAGTSTLQNIIPAGNLQYSIGSPESRLQNVYTNNLILGSASFVMEDVGGVLRFRDVNSVIPGLVIDPSSGATINGNVFINGGATFVNATTTGSHSIGGALVLGGKSFQNLMGVGLKVASSTLALDNSGDWSGTFDGQEASYFLANSFSTSSANSWLGGKTTNNLTEGGNLYYTDARARNALSVSAPLSYSASTGAFSIPQAGSAANGYLSSTDWNIFNNKQSATLNNGLLWIGNASNIATAVALSGDATINNAGALTISDGVVTLSKLAADSVDSSKIADGAIVNVDIASSTITNAKLINASFTTVIGTVGTDVNVSGSSTSLGGTLTLNLPTASSTARGLLSSTDWSTFNNKENAINASTTATYFRGDKTFQTLDTSAVPENGNVYYTDTRFDNRLASKTTGNLAEGANLYYTDVRARNALSVSAPLLYSTSTGAFSLATGNLTAPSNPEITISGGTGAVLGSGVTFVIPEASTSTRGLISTTTQIFAGDKTFYGGLKTESTVGAIMTAGSDGAFAYNFGSGVSNSLSKRVAQSSDDAEQSLATNGVNLTSSDLELINDGGVNQEVGIRFQNITIPQGATITNSYVEFTTNAVTTGTTNLNFYGEAADNAATFTSATNNITGRAKTSSMVAWSAVPAWNTIGTTNQTPNLASLVQEIVNRAGWLSGNSLAIIINGTAGSLRNAVSYNGGASSAALLVVQYTTDSTNVAYTINNLGPGLFRINDEFNDASPFVVDSSGNVGIGTSTPSNTLSVAGNSTFSGTLNVSGASTLATTTASSLTLSPMTQGSLLFAGAGGLVSQNNSNLFWDNTNNRLGVGALSPNARLYVKTSDLTSTPFYIEGQDNAFTGLSGWFYRKPVVIDNTANSVSYSNQQTFVSVDTAGLISAGKLQSNCADLRFTNTDGASILPHWIEYGCNSAATGIWVKIPTLPAGITKTIYAYYGSPTATSTSSGAGVFTFFDDFPTNQARFYNTEYPSWTVQSGSWIIPSGNYLANYYGGDMITINSPSAGIGAAVRAKMTETAAWKYARLLIGWQDANNYYAATLNSGGGQLNIQKVVGGTQTLLASINASVTAGTWYEVELRWVSSTTIEAQIWDANGNSLGVAQGAISEGWTGGKFGAHGISGVSQARFENYMTLQYAPNITSNIGAEESSGAPQQLPFFVVKNQTGKVGIGEANPGAKLSVSGGLAIGSDFDTTSVSDGNAIFSGRLGVGVVSPSNALTFAASSVIDSQGALSITTASGGALSLTSNGSGNVVIDSGTSGALNIGAGANGKTITLGNTTVGTTLAFNAGNATTGNINFDSNTLYVDTVNNRVGIGTASPGAKLHVVGVSNTAGFLFDIADIGATVPFKIAGTDVGTASTVLSATVLTNNTTGGNQNGMLIENAAGSGVTDALLKLNNADTDTAVVDGLLITSANGLVTDAIDVSGTNITNAINIGGNKIVGDALSIDGDGNVGIGTSTPDANLRVWGSARIGSVTGANPAYELYVANNNAGPVARFQDTDGFCDINPTSASLGCASDISLKKNILTLDSSLEKTLALNPVTFNWRSEEDDAATHLGFIAQEVEELFPALVSTDESGLKSLAYSNFAPILVSAMQEQFGGLQGLKFASTTNYREVFSSTTALDELAQQSGSNFISDPIDYIRERVNQGIKIVRTLVAEKMIAVDGYFKRIFADEVRMKKLCVGETCVTENELKALLEKDNVPSHTEPVEVIENDAAVPTNGTAATISVAQDVQILPAPVPTPAEAVSQSTAEEQSSQNIGTTTSTESTSALSANELTVAAESQQPSSDQQSTPEPSPTPEPSEPIVSEPVPVVNEPTPSESAAANEF